MCVLQTVIQTSAFGPRIGGDNNISRTTLHSVARYMLWPCILPSVRLSQANAVPKWLNSGSRTQRRTDS